MAAIGSQYYLSAEIRKIASARGLDTALMLLDLAKASRPDAHIRGSELLSIFAKEDIAQTSLQKINWQESLTVIEREGVRAGELAQLCGTQFCVSGWADGVRALVIGGWQEGMLSWRGETAACLAHLGAWSGDLETILTLVEAGLDFKAFDSQGLTPMHWLALGASDPLAAHELLRQGVDPLARDSWRAVAFQYSRSEAFWAWSLSMAWAAQGKGLRQIELPLSESYDSWARELGGARLERWVRWELGAAMQGVPEDAKGGAWGAVEFHQRASDWVARELGNATLSGYDKR